MADLRGVYVRKVYEEIEKSRRKLNDYKMLGSPLFWIKKQTNREKAGIFLCKIQKLAVFNT